MRPVARPSDLALAAIDIGRARELLLHRCTCATSRHRWRSDGCGRCDGGRVRDPDTAEDVPCADCWTDGWVQCRDGHYTDPRSGQRRDCPLCRPHTLGEHVDRALNAMTPGVRASRTDGVRVNGTGTGETDDDRELPGDPTLLLPARFRSKVAAAWSAALDVVDIIQAHRPDRRTDADVSASDDFWCRSCLRIGECSPRFRGDLCHRPCYEFGQVAKKDPPVWLLRLYHEGRRISQEDMGRAISEVRRRKKRKAG